MHAWPKQSDAGTFDGELSLDSSTSGFSIKLFLKYEKTSGRRFIRGC
jgi:hypothetical protein